MLGLTPEQNKKLLLSVGSHRGTRQFSPIEVAETLKISIDAGSKLSDLANALHLDGTSMVTRFLRLLELSPQVQHWVDWGESGSTIGFTAAFELSRLADPDEQSQLGRAALENQLKSSEVREIVQLRRRSERSLAECVEEIMRMRPHVEKLHLFIGAIIPQELRAALRARTQSERDKLLRSAVVERYPNLRQFSSRLGVERFTLSGGDAVSRILRGTSEDFESAINSVLSRKITE